MPKPDTYIRYGTFHAVVQSLHKSKPRKNQSETGTGFVESAANSHAVAAFRGAPAYEQIQVGHASIATTD